VKVIINKRKIFVIISIWLQKEHINRQKEKGLESLGLGTEAKPPRGEILSSEEGLLEEKR
jgi:hypothetical protein